jgi:hypothetical protein
MEKRIQSAFKAIFCVEYVKIKSLKNVYDFA